MSDARPILSDRLAPLKAPLPGLPARGGRIALRMLMLLFGSRFRERGAERMAELEGPVIIAPNHLNYFEAILTPSTLMYLRAGAPPRFLIDWMFHYIPVLGWMLDHNRTIKVWHKKAKVPLLNRVRDRHADDDPLEAAAEALAQGDWVGIYPEGKCNRDPHQLLKGRGGLARLALESGAPVLPLGIDYEGRREGRRVPSWPRLTLNFGEPMRFEAERDALERARGDETFATVRRQMEREVTRRVMDAIGTLSGKFSAESAQPELAAPRRMQWPEPALPTKS